MDKKIILSIILNLNILIGWLKFVIPVPWIPVIFEPFSKNSPQINSKFEHGKLKEVDPLLPLQ